MLVSEGNNLLGGGGDQSPCSVIDVDTSGPRTVAEADLAFGWALLANVVRLPQAAESAVSLLQGMHPLAAYPLLDVVYRCATDYWEAHRQLISPDLLYGASLDLISATGTATTPQNLRAAVDYVYGLPSDQLSGGWAQSYMSDLRKDAISEKLRSRILAGSASRTDIEKLVRDAASELDRAVPSQPNIVDDMAKLSLSESLAMVHKEPLYVPFLDQHLGGGLARGESALMIIPSGGGKTTLSLQLGHAGAIAKRKVTVVMLEQPLEGDVLLRNVVLASGGSRADWETYAKLCSQAKHENRPPPDVRKHVSPSLVDRYYKTCDVLKKHLVLVDYTKSAVPICNIQQIFAKVREYDLISGMPTDLLLVDWLGVIRDNMLAAGMAQSEQMARALFRQQLKGINAACQQLNCSSIFFHQLSGAASKKTTPVSTKDAQEDTNLDNYFSHAFAVSATDRRKQAWVNHGKGRSSGTGLFRWMVDGEHCVIKLPTPDQTAGPVSMAGVDNVGGLVGSNFRI